MSYQRCFADLYEWTASTWEQVCSDSRTAVNSSGKLYSAWRSKSQWDYHLATCAKGDLPRWSCMDHWWSRRRSEVNRMRWCTLGCKLYCSCNEPQNSAVWMAFLHKIHGGVPSWICARWLDPKNIIKVKANQVKSCHPINLDSPLSLHWETCYLTGLQGTGVEHVCSEFAKYIVHNWRLTVWSSSPLFRGLYSNKWFDCATKYQWSIKQMLMQCRITLATLWILTTSTVQLSSNQQIIKIIPCHALHKMAALLYRFSHRLLAWAFWVWISQDSPVWEYQVFRLKLWRRQQTWQKKLREKNKE